MEEPLLSPLRRETSHNSTVEQRDSEKHSERSLTQRLLQHRPLQIVCGILHVSLVCIHVALILIANHKLEQRIMFDVRRSVAASTSLTVILQAFGTAYTVGMVFTMQQLAISHKLSGSTTLTETHDVNTAWLGLGSALLTLRRQLTRPAALYSTLIAVIYLSGIATLHITTPALFSIQTTSLQTPTDVKTFGMANYTAVNKQDCEYTQGMGPSWYGPLTALSPITSVSQHANFSGLVNGTLYDILDDNMGQGQISVNATYFNVTCGTLSDDTFLTSFDSKTGYSVFDAINYNFTVSGRPLLPGDLTILPILLSRPVFVILTTASFMDSQKNVSGTYPVNYATAPWLPVTSVQRLACTFQPVRTKVTVDVKTKLLQGRAPVQTYSVFRTTAADGPSSQSECDPVSGLQTLASLAMKQSVPASPTWTDPYNMDCGTFCKENEYSVSVQEQYLMENLGFPAPFSSTGSNATFLLHDLENAMSNMFATLFWSDVNMGAAGSSTDRREQRLSTVKISQPKVRVVASMTPLQIGLAASLVLLTTAAPFFLSPLRTPSKVDTLGILQVLWLLREDAVANVVDPTTENLRAAGMVGYDFREDRLASSRSSS